MRALGLSKQIRIERGGNARASRSRRILGFKPPGCLRPPRERPRHSQSRLASASSYLGLARSSQGTELLRRGVYISPPPAPSTKHASPWLALIANDGVRLGEVKRGTAPEQAPGTRPGVQTRLQARLLSKQRAREPNAVALTRCRHASAASTRN